MPKVVTDDPKPIPSEKARQGRWGWQVLMVLVCGLLLAAVAWYGAEIFGESTETPATQGTVNTQ